MANKPLYIQLEPGAYPKDIDWQSMSPSDRGCYHSLIIYLACSDGTLPNDTEKLAVLCNINAQEFEKFWKSFSHKFIEKDGQIEHRRVSDELKKARNYLKQKSLAGKKGMQRRYNSDITALQQNSNDDITKEREVKGSKVKERIYSQDSDEYRLASLLFNLILQRNPGHKKPDLQKWAVHTDRMIRLDKREVKSIEDVIRWAQASDFWHKNILGTEKLRDKYDQLTIQMKADGYKPADTCYSCHGTENLKHKSVNDIMVYFCPNCEVPK